MGCKTTTKTNNKRNVMKINTRNSQKMLLSYHSLKNLVTQEVSFHFHDPVFSLASPITKIADFLLLSRSWAFSFFTVDV